MANKERFLTGICSMCNLSSVLVIQCIIYLVENEWERAQGSFYNLVISHNLLIPYPSQERRIMP